jgi:hypothetical protein
VLSIKDLESASNLILIDAVACVEASVQAAITEKLFDLLLVPLQIMMPNFSMSLVVGTQIDWFDAKQAPKKFQLYDQEVTVGVFSVGARGVLSILKDAGDFDMVEINSQASLDYLIDINSLYICKVSEFMNKVRIQDGYEEGVKRGAFLVSFRGNDCWPMPERYEALYDKLCTWLPSSMNPNCVSLIEEYVITVVRGAFDQRFNKPRTVVLYKNHLKQIDAHGLLDDTTMDALMIYLRDFSPGALGFQLLQHGESMLRNYYTELLFGDQIFQLIHIPPNHYGICFAHERVLYFVCPLNHLPGEEAKRRMSKIFCDPRNPLANLEVQCVHVQPQTEVECGCRAFLGGLVFLSRGEAFDLASFGKLSYPSVQKQYELVKRCVLEGNQAQLLMQQALDEILSGPCYEAPKIIKKKVFTINFAQSKVSIKITPPKKLVQPQAQVLSVSLYVFYLLVCLNV